MKLALIGYGKMGKEIEKAAIERGHKISLVVDRHNQQDLCAKNLKDVDVAVEFTDPGSAFANYLRCFEEGVPVVSGTTGWLDKLPQVKEKCKEGNAFFYAPNFSLGVNLFFELNKKLAKLMSAFEEYDVDVEETHHIHKLDSPSGTAITLAEAIIENHPQKKQWSGSPGSRREDLTILSKRHGAVPGTHAVTWHSEADEIMIRHRAYSRKGFALGAVLAAEFLVGKKGFFGMKDLLDL